MVRHTPIENLYVDSVKLKVFQKAHHQYAAAMVELIISVQNLKYRAKNSYY